MIMEIQEITPPPQPFSMDDKIFQDRDEVFNAIQRQAVGNAKDLQ